MPDRRPAWDPPWRRSGHVRDVFVGRAGLECMVGPGFTVECAAGDGFRVDLGSVWLSRARLDDFQATAHSIAFASESAGVAVDDLLLVIMRAGADLRVEQDGRTEVIEPGGIVLLRYDADFRYACEDDASFVVVQVPRSVLAPLAAEMISRVTARPLDADVLRLTATRIIEVVSSAAAEIPTVEAVGIEGAIVALIEALIARLGTGHAADFPGDAVVTAKRFILAHLSDPTLEAPIVASAVGVSLRQLQRRFAEDGVGIAEYIRDRRLDELARRLRSARSMPAIAAIALSVGFSSNTVATRAFRARFSESMRGYWRRHRAERVTASGEDTPPQGG